MKVPNFGLPIVHWLITSSKIYKKTNDQVPRARSYRKNEGTEKKNRGDSGRDWGLTKKHKKLKCKSTKPITKLFPQWAQWTSEKIIWGNFHVWLELYWLESLCFTLKRLERRKGGRGSIWLRPHPPMVFPRLYLLERAWSPAFFDF